MSAKGQKCRKITRLLALEDTINVARREPALVGDVGSLGRENAVMGETKLDADHSFLAPFRTDLN
jgi:hypothetical protein